MATNKTRIVYFDITEDVPSQVILQTEFDIYQDALDYIESFATVLAGASAENNSWKIFVYSYDNTSYKYYKAGGAVTKATATFPENIG